MTTPTRVSASNRPAPSSDLACHDGASGSSRRRRLLYAAFGLLGVSIVVIASWFAWFREPPRDPLVAFAQPIPADVETEARAAVADFADVFGERRGCLSTAEVVLVRNVEGGDARYERDGALIEIEIPTTPARFQESLIHELAHHVEYVCPAFDDLRSAWIAEGGEPWWSGQARWEDRPSEQWAETVVELVLGERLLHADEMVLDPRLVELATGWLEG